MALYYYDDFDGDSSVTVQEGQTIQDVIDGCPVAVGTLKEGFTNPYVIKVPPGHEKEFYSLVRNVSDDASDKRNVKVVFEDNPAEKFIIHSYDECEALPGWIDSGQTLLELDNSHNFCGENCFKVSIAEGNSVIQKTISPAIDIRQYQGMLVDIEINSASIDRLKFLFYNSDLSTYIYTYLSYQSAAANEIIRTTAYIPFFPETTFSGTFDYSDLAALWVTAMRTADYVGETLYYIDNIRFIRTTPHRTAILRFDDGTDDQLIATKLLEAKGWRGSFGVYRPALWGNSGSPGRISKQELLAMESTGHEIANHTILHSNMKNVDKQTTTSDFINMKKCLEANGLTKSSKIFIAPYHSSNVTLMSLLKKAGAISCYESYGPFPAPIASLTDPTFGIPAVLQRFIDSGMGGIVQILTHTISNEANFSARLDWIEENFSEIILASEPVDRLPKEYQPIEQNIVHNGYKITLSANFLLYQWHGGCVLLDPGGAARNITPVEEFQAFSKIEIVNTADAAETITFDPTFNAAGAHDGADNADILTDSGESWTVGQLVGRTLSNTTDGSSGIITANTTTTVSAILSGGTDSDWDIGDTYTITPAGLNQAIAQNERGAFVYDGSGWLKIFVG